MNEAIDSRPTVVILTKPGCGPCRALTRWLDHNLTDDERGRVFYADATDSGSALANEALESAKDAKVTSTPVILHRSARGAALVSIGYGFKPGLVRAALCDGHEYMWDEPRYL